MSSESLEKNLSSSEEIVEGEDFSSEKKPSEKKSNFRSIKSNYSQKKKELQEAFPNEGGSRSSAFRSAVPQRTLSSTKNSTSSTKNSTDVEEEVSSPSEKNSSSTSEGKKFVYKQIDRSKTAQSIYGFLVYFKRDDSTFRKIKKQDILDELFSTLTFSKKEMREITHLMKNYIVNVQKEGAYISLHSQKWFLICDQTLSEKLNEYPAEGALILAPYTIKCRDPNYENETSNLFIYSTPSTREEIFQMANRAIGVLEDNHFISDETRIVCRREKNEKTGKFSGPIIGSIKLIFQDPELSLIDIKIIKEYLSCFYVEKSRGQLERITSTWVKHNSK